MKRTTHMISGAAVGVLVSSVSGGDVVAYLAIGALFGVVPDLDMLLSGFGKGIHRSPASHSLLASALLAMAWAAFLIISDLLSWLGMIPAISLAGSTVVVFFASFLHAAEDSLTLSGTRLLYPLSTRIYRGPVRYDDLAANVILSVLALFLILLSLQTDMSSFFG